MGVRQIAGAAVRAGWRVIALATLAGPAAAAAGEVAGAARILYFEPLRVLPGSTIAADQKSAGAQQLRFDAYGRRFELSLAANGRLMEQLNAKPGSSLKLLKGAIDGVAGSWVRLAAKDGALHGMMWDGAHLYAIEPAAAVGDNLVPPLQAGVFETVLFRMADVLVDSGQASCAAESASSVAKVSDPYQSLLQELKNAPAVLQALGASRRLDLSVLGDASFLQRYENEQAAREAILTRLNNVDGIFSSQLGIEVRVGNLSVHTASTDPLSSETSPNGLLRELGKLRRRSPELHAHGLTHLFTHRDLDGTTIGIAYLDSLCSIEYAVGLTEARNAWLDSLVSAHEIGHNFGADHDGDAAGTCASTSSSGYLMSSIVGGDDDFSQCSLTRMLARAQAASCITSLPPANVSIPTHLGFVRRAVSSSFAWELPVTNAGGLSARNVRATLALPATVMVDDVGVVGGSCTSGAGTIRCELGDIGGGNARSVRLTLHSDVIGANTITAHVMSDNDASMNDNDGEGVIGIQQQADVAISIQGPVSAITHEPFAAGFRLTHAGGEGTGAIVVTIEMPDNVTIASASLGNGVCMVENSAVRCTLTSLGPGATVEGSVLLKASATGSATLRVHISGDYLDSNSANDEADLSVAIGAAAASSAPTSAAAPRGGGGGGSFGLLLLLALGPLACPNFLGRRRA